jgi:signal transduction histidine kinase
VTLSFVILLKNFFRSREFERIQFTYVAVSVIPPSIISLFTNLLFPAFGFFEFNWFGQLSALIMPVFITYAISRHHLMNIRVIGTELFAAIISVIFIVQILFSQTTSEVFIRTILFLLIAIFGLFLIRGTLREVETLRRLSQAKTEFISVASHQLRSPLTAIKGYVSMLLEGGFNSSPSESHQVLEKVYKSNERLIRLIDELLDISRIEEGRFEFTMEQLSFFPFICDIVDELQGAVDKSRLSLVFFPPKADPPRAENSGNHEYFVSADSEKLRQAFQNLIDNAIRYTPKGEIKVWCEIRGNHIITAVSDTGIGMSKDDLTRIFERFSRGKASSHHHTEGAGLGLYIARKIVEAHKGKMWAQSEGPGKGSTFFVELPLINNKK